MEDIREVDRNAVFTGDLLAISDHNTWKKLYGF